MHVRRLVVSDDDKTSALDIPAPDWGQIEAAIRRLNGGSRSLVAFGAADLPSAEHMYIGGGDSGTYICSVYCDDGSQLNLADASQGSDDIVTVMVCQPVAYPRSQCVSLEKVLAAAAAYVETGQAAEGMVWEAV
jgi:hypothetical protein